MSLSFEDLRTIISSGKKKEFARAMFDILTEKQHNLPDFYDFFGKLIKEDINFTMSKSYFFFRRYAQNILLLEQLMEMDKILMENYALSRHEPIEYYFSGQINRYTPTIGIGVRGVIYFTKLRVIALGPSTKDSETFTGLIAGAISPPVSGALDNTFRNRIQETLGADFSEAEYIKFDHIYPINKPYNIRKRKNIIKYKTDIEYKTKGKVKKKKLFIGLIPLKEKNEDKNAFDRRKEENLNKIESFLLSYQ